MSDLGPHGFYILAAFLATGAVLIVMLASSLWHHRDATRRLAALEAAKNDAP